MKTAEEFLIKLYKRIKPQLVVEIGADPAMKLVARTGSFSKEIAVVDFKAFNDYKKGWWEMHREMGNINLRRIDGNACSLSNLVQRADIVYAHNVLIELNERDTERMIQYKSGEIVMRIDEARKMYADFDKAKMYALKEACKVAKDGHVVWFSQTEVNPPYIEEAIKGLNKSVHEFQLLGSTGENPNFILNTHHICPTGFDWDKNQTSFDFYKKAI